LGLCDGGGTTPLMVAAAMDRVDLVRRLLALDTPIGAKDKCGHTAAEIAASIGASKALRALLEVKITGRNDMSRTRRLLGWLISSALASDNR